MASIIAKIKKHGILKSFQIATTLLTFYLNRIPGQIKISLAKNIASCDGILIKNIQGNPMVLDLNEVGISHELFLTGIHEAESTAEIRDEIKPGMSIVEIGANIGYYAIIEAKIIGESGKIYAFEPSPTNMKTLKTNIALNSLDNIFTTYPYGVGSKSADQEFFLMSKGNMSSFVPRKEDNIIKKVGTVNIKVVSLDDFFGINSVKIDYVRMDVEGFEFEVIKGMEGILTAEISPKGLFIEVHSELLNNMGSSCKEFIEHMVKMGYEIKRSRYRGKREICVSSTDKLLDHKLREIGYWETFFVKDQRS